jgi:putative transcription factor
MRCEVCGRKIHSDPVTAVIEGAKLTVCPECSKHGKIVIEEETVSLPPTRTVPSQKRAVPIHLASRKKAPVATVDTSQEIVEGYSSLIRHAREKLGLSHEDLGKKINEKTSVLRNIETGKMTPDNALVVKLEHTLKIKLLAPVTEEKIPQETGKSTDEEFTLGDIIQFDKKGGEEPTERKPS